MLQRTPCCKSCVRMKETIHMQVYEYQSIGYVRFICSSSPLNVKETSKLKREGKYVPDSTNGDQQVYLARAILTNIKNICMDETVAVRYPNATPLLDQFSLLSIWLNPLLHWLLNLFGPHT